MKLLAIYFSVILMMTACNNSDLPIKNKALTISKNGEHLYQCGNNVQVKATYYALSDDSLSFVKLALPNEPEITLAQAISASGERYSNESLEWWVTGLEAFAQTRNQDQEWQFMYQNCHAIEKAS